MTIFIDCVDHVYVHLNKTHENLMRMLFIFLIFVSTLSAGIYSAVKYELLLKNIYLVLIKYLNTLPFLTVA